MNYSQTIKTSQEDTTRWCYAPAANTNVSIPYHVYQINHINHSSDSQATNTITDRGYTGHEHLDHYTLINMNGRLYDPQLSRMLSPDNFVQLPDYSQSFNRYSYAWNNPLVYTDPDGDFLTWNIGNNGFSIGLNFTPAGVPLGFGVNVGWSDGFTTGVYGEVGPRFLGNGIGYGATISQSFDYNYKYNSWSTTTSEGAYASLGLFNSGFSYSQTYSFESNQWTNNWGISFGVGIGNDNAGIGLNVGYGSSGWNYGVGGYYNPPKPEVYKSPVSNNTDEGGCALRCLEEFSESYNMGPYDYEYWLEQNDFNTIVNRSNVENLVNNTRVFSSESLKGNVVDIINAISNDKRVLMGFKPSSSEYSHAVMVRKIKVWTSERYKIYFAETSPVRLIPRYSTNISTIIKPEFWIFYPDK